ncbi:hypothetical protein ACHAXA_004346 [Cyclostephanos tholiformis]|uniref:Amino acid transporter transmembrane domain-containing protein n=1 Tax=Cyclostephanos tholiformis TaxID=382380 RepID=A0ABD3SPI5_9STRA
MSTRDEHMSMDVTDDDSIEAPSMDASYVEGYLPSSSSTMPPNNYMTCRRRWEKMNPGPISNLCSATLGAGALSLPFAISLTGIALGVVLLIFSAVLTIYSIDVIIDACARTRLFKYEHVSQRLVGQSATRLLEASILIFCFGVSAPDSVAVIARVLP